MEWKDIYGYEGLYQISNTGEIRSLDRKILYSNGKKTLHKGKNKEIQIRPRTNYRTINLYNSEKKYRQLYVHRLVAAAFLPNDDIVNKVQVNHIDGDKGNNNASNLEWCTALHNMQHARKTGLLKMCTNKNTLSDKVVIEVLDLFDKGIPSRKVAKLLNFPAKTISRIRRGETYSFVQHPRNYLKNKI